MLPHSTLLSLIYQFINCYYLHYKDQDSFCCIHYICVCACKHSFTYFKSRDCLILHNEDMQRIIQSQKVMIS